MGTGARQYQPVHPVQETRRARKHPGRTPRRVYDKPRTLWDRLKEFDERDSGAGGPGFIPDDKREEIERVLATVNPAEFVRRIHDIQDRLEDMAAPRTARLARRAGPDMAYLNKTLARIAGVKPEDNETPPADKDQDFALTPSEAPPRITRSLSNEAPRVRVSVMTWTAHGTPA